MNNIEDFKEEISRHSLSSEPLAHYFLVGGKKKYLVSNYLYGSIVEAVAGKYKTALITYGSDRETTKNHTRKNPGIDFYDIYTDFPDELVVTLIRDGQPCKVVFKDIELHLSHQSLVSSWVECYYISTEWRWL